MAHEDNFAPDPITLICLLAAFVVGLLAWGDILAPLLLTRYGEPVRAIVVSTEARSRHGAVADYVTYTYVDRSGTRHEVRERVPSLAQEGMPADGYALTARYFPLLPGVARLAGNEASGAALALLAAAVFIGLAGLANFRQWRYPDSPRDPRRVE